MKRHVDEAPARLFRAGGDPEPLIRVNVACVPLLIIATAVTLVDPQALRTKMVGLLVLYVVVNLGLGLHLGARQLTVYADHLVYRAGLTRREILFSDISAVAAQRVRAGWPPASVLTITLHTGAPPLRLRAFSRRTLQGLVVAIRRAAPAVLLDAESLVLAA